ncbi:MAG: 30S ribosomal protein S17 [Thermoplasmata archaeon]
MSPPPKPSARRARDIGLDVRSPKEHCDDAHCPFHGHLSVRGQIFEATVVSTAMQRTAVVERTILRRIPKYERYAKRRRRYLVHDPPCLKVRVGRLVRVAETRPLSKTVTFCIVEDLGDAARRTSGDDVVPVSDVPPKEEAK